jgi:hypothetical protein
VNTGNLAYLIISGKPGSLEVAWAKIYEEYLSLTNDTKFSTTFRIKKDIYYLTNKLQIISTIVTHLEDRYNSELCKHLRSLGFNLKFTQESINKDLELVAKLSKSIILRVQQLNKEYATLTKEEKAVTKQDYYDAMASLEKFRGGGIDPKTTTLMQFISLFNLFKKQNSK